MSNLIVQCNYYGNKLVKAKLMYYSVLYFRLTIKHWVWLIILKSIISKSSCQYTILIKKSLFREYFNAYLIVFFKAYLHVFLELEISKPSNEYQNIGLGI